jgi:glycosyltransferase involved in cell wall biosynthesis
MKTDVRRICSPSRNDPVTGAGLVSRLAGGSAMSTQLLSFVIPVKNEQATVGELLARIRTAVSALGRSCEVIFVDDGSDDESWSVIRSLVDAHETGVRAIRFRRNLGKAAALSAGFGAARGDVIMTLDADLQDDPREIGRFLAKLDEG